jgi:hypothetical protein
MRLQHVPGKKELLEAHDECIETGLRYCLEESIQMGINHHQHLGFTIYYHERRRRSVEKETSSFQHRGFTIYHLEYEADRKNEKKKGKGGEEASFWLYQNEKHHIDRLLALCYTINFFNADDIMISWKN